MFPNGKRSLHQFQCSDVLWATFQRMAEEQERDVGELLTDAMTAYAQLSGYQTDVNEIDPAAGEATPPPPMSVATPAHDPVDAAAPVVDAARTVRRHTGAGAELRRHRRRRRHRRGPRRSPTLGSAGPPPLYLVFDNQKYRIDKDQFIIGRGAKSSDLPIKDGNISRKHAAVIRRNGTYFIKDLGSTNGIDFKGMRIDNKRIDEGDTFHLCDYELKFTYKR